MSRRRRTSGLRPLGALCLALWLALPAGNCAAAPAGARLEVGARLSEVEGGLQLSLPVLGTVRPSLFTMEGPPRLVIDLPDARPAAGWSPPVARGSVLRVRAAPRGRGYRLVLDLARPLAAAPAWQLDPGVLTVRLGAAAPLPAPSPDAPPRVGPAEAPAAVRTVRQEGRDIVVVVDAGHGGEDPGASGPGGTHEKDVVLAIARALAARLDRQPGVRAVLTRDSDRFIELRDRMDKARTERADLFVSVHADAVRDHTIAGASVYTLSYRGASSEAARLLADRENAAVLKGGVGLDSGNPQLDALLLDVAQNANMGASVEAADQVLRALDRVGAVRKREVQHAAFVVLKSPDVPSMLVETAYISNPAEERRLRTADWQQQLAAAIEEGVRAYFRAHPPDGTLYAAQRKAAPPL